jgi:ParB-like chromosome segregation protein Spo0J
MDSKFYDHKVASVADLIPYALNSREHSDDQVAQIAASIRAFGFTNPVLIDEANNLIAGHGRVMAARKLGMTEVPAIVVTGMDERKRRALIIADNKLALNASWDMEALLVEVRDLGGKFGELMGFSDDELAAMMGANMEDVETELPQLADGDREPFQQMTFTLHDDQAEQVKAAMEKAKAMGAFIDTGNENGNGNALARICETFNGIS